MKRILLLGIALLLLPVMAAAQDGDSTESGSTGIYQFAGMAFPIASEADSGATIDVELGGYVKTFPGSFTLTAPQYQRNSNEERLAVSLVQGIYFGDHFAAGAGVVGERYDVIHDDAAPTNYLGFRVFLSAFSTGFTKQPAQNLGLGAILDYTPGNEQTVIKVGTVLKW